MRNQKEFGAAKSVVAFALALALMFPATAAWSDVEESEKITPVSFFRDGWISMRLETAYLLDGKLNTFDVDAEVSKGVVQVIGFVPTMAERDRALVIAREMPGVKRVEDKLIVDPDYKTKLAKGEFFEQGLGDYWTARRVKTRLLISPRVTGTWIGVEADEGAVTLRGSVYEHKEIKSAEEIAFETPGVKEIDNRIICCRR